MSILYKHYTRCLGQRKKNGTKQVSSDKYHKEKESRLRGIENEGEEVL